MPQEQSRLRVRREGGVTRIEFVDRNILDEANIQHIAEEIGELIESSEEPRLLISFANVDHLSSAALGALITINNKVRSRNGALRLADIDPNIREVFHITRLERLFEIHDTTEQALASF